MDTRLLVISSPAPKLNRSTVARTPKPKSTMPISKCYNSSPFGHQGDTSDLVGGESVCVALRIQDCKETCLDRVVVVSEEL